MKPMMKTAKMKRMMITNACSTQVVVWTNIAKMTKRLRQIPVMKWSRSTDPRGSTIHWLLFAMLVGTSDYIMVCTAVFVC